ncbi:hypothetical protein ACQPZF_12570 [Actinosynnema sp. CS-041913]|uniref:hypothetical protein n=1 Tax=Actinosynnema sp. CS-041913 TaxID=3239917 RepID=UPI003D8D323E
MSVDRELFERALGDEPPLGLDVAAIERAEALRARRRRIGVPLAAATVAVVLIGGGAALTGGIGASSGGPGSSGATAAPSAASKPTRETAVPGNREAGYCYRTADITSREVNQHLLFGIAGAGPDGRGDITAHIMSICDDAWRNNYSGWNGTPRTDGTAHPVPELVACVLDDRAVDTVEGAIAVFPGTPDTCAGLGLPVADLGR